MLISIGTRVCLRHSGETGVVTALLENNMAQVLIDGEDMEIPAFTDDLLPARITHPQDPVQSVRPESETEIIVGTHTGQTGLSLSFVPELRDDASPAAYRIFLINDTPFTLLLEYRRRHGSQEKAQKHLQLDAHRAQFLEIIPLDALNEQITIDLECCRLRTDGTGPRQNKRLRIKPKAFFKALQDTPILNEATHLFSVFSQIKSERARTTNPSEDLQIYTRKKVKPRRTDGHLRPYRPHEVEEFAQFMPELDLHIDQLISNAREKTPAEILAIQLRHFDQYLDDAVRLGVERVFIIHGLGKGRLRQHIRTRLQGRPEVLEFRNEYHPNYGFGATEVILR